MEQASDNKLDKAFVKITPMAAEHLGSFPVQPSATVEPVDFQQTNAQSFWIRP
jgi:hypothetical protein